MRFTFSRVDPRGSLELSPHRITTFRHGWDLRGIFNVDRLDDGASTAGATPLTGPVGASRVNAAAGQRLNRTSSYGPEYANPGITPSPECSTRGPTPLRNASCQIGA